MRRRSKREIDIREKGNEKYVCIKFEMINCMVPVFQMTNLQVC